MSFSVPEVLYHNFDYPFAMFPPCSVYLLNEGALDRLAFLSLNPGVVVIMKIFFTNVQYFEIRKKDQSKNCAALFC